MQRVSGVEWSGTCGVERNVWSGCYRRLERRGVERVVGASDAHKTGGSWGTGAGGPDLTEAGEVCTRRLQPYTRRSSLKQLPNL